MIFDYIYAFLSDGVSFMNTIYRGVSLGKYLLEHLGKYITGHISTPKQFIRSIVLGFWYKWLSGRAQSPLICCSSLLALH